MPLSTRFALDWLRRFWGRSVVQKEYEMNGDMVVCGVSDDEVIEDISRPVPKSVATFISGYDAQRSKDLWRLLSQSRLIRLNVNPLLRAAIPASGTPSPPTDEGLMTLQAEYNKAVAEVSRLRNDLALARSEAISARGELARANEELSRLRGGDQSKLDDILALLKERPATVVTMTTAAAPTRESVAVEDDIPMFIPSQIKSDASDSRLVVKEESTSASTLSDASKALREKRKKQ